MVKRVREYLLPIRRYGIVEIDRTVFEIWVKTPFWTWFFRDNAAKWLLWRGLTAAFTMRSGSK